MPEGRKKKRRKRGEGKKEGIRKSTNFEGKTFLDNC